MGSYELTDLLGRGGMGEVWQGKHRLLTRDAAVKLIHPKALGAQDEDKAMTVLKRFEREAQATAVLRSPHTIEVYDFGIARDGTFYYVMELLNGLDLHELVEKFGPQPPSRVVHILKQACHSLHEAHVGGLVHRDIKPSNLFLCRYGLDADFTKVLDFGIVKQQVEEREGAGQLTEVGMVSGTPAFLSPEAVVEDVKLDGRADLYALGCVGYWLLTGQLVFDKPSPMGLVMAHTNEQPVPISERTANEVPADLEKVLMSCLAKDPTDRPRDAHQLALLLGNVASAGDWTQEAAGAWWAEHEADLT
jgi:serine/threonine-protein kinase